MVSRDKPRTKTLICSLALTFLRQATSRITSHTSFAFQQKTLESQRLRLYVWPSYHENCRGSAPQFPVSCRCCQPIWCARPCCPSRPRSYCNRLSHPCMGVFDLLSTKNLLSSVLAANASFSKSGLLNAVAHAVRRKDANRTVMTVVACGMRRRNCLEGIVASSIVAGSGKNWVTTSLCIFGSQLALLFLIHTGLVVY